MQAEQEEAARMAEEKAAAAATVELVAESKSSQAVEPAAASTTEKAVEAPATPAELRIARDKLEGGSTFYYVWYRPASHGSSTRVCIAHPPCLTHLHYVQHPPTLRHCRRAPTACATRVLPPTTMCCSNGPRRTSVERLRCHRCRRQCGVGRRPGMLLPNAGRCSAKSWRCWLQATTACDWR